MNNRTLFLLCCVMLPLVTGCSTLSRTECVSGNWEQIGYEDGSNGYRGDRIENHREACKEYGVAPDASLYRKGRDKGLLNYCTPSQGYAEGKRGVTYRHVCPPDLEPGFMRNYQVGIQVYELDQQIREVESRIRSKERERDKDKLTEERRRSIRDHIHDLEREKRNLQRLRQSTEWMVIY